MKPLMVALLALPILIAFAACGGGDDDDDDDDGGSPGTPEAAPHISQDSLKFEPNEVTMVAGDTLTVTNDESALHTVKLDGENVSGDMERDDVFELTLDDVGTYELTCNYHPQMRATVYVVEGTE